MGGCLSKKTKGDPNTCLLRSKKQVDASSREPPPTESPPQIEEEKVKEVMSETPTRFVRATTKSNCPVENGLEMEQSDLCTRRNRRRVTTPSESISGAASISLTSDNTRAAPDEEEEGETVEMKLKTTMKKKMIMMSSSEGMPRSQSPSAKTRAHSAAGKRELGGVDVGCPGIGPSPSPMRSREMGNHTRNHINNNNGDRVVAGGERRGRRMRSVSLATSSLESPSSGTKILSSSDQQPQRRNRHCRSLSSSTAANRRFSPPARARRQGRDGNFNACGGSDGTALLKEESLQNPLVSMECFIFL